jgi:hypothetical protein
LIYFILSVKKVTKISNNLLRNKFIAIFETGIN